MTFKLYGIDFSAYLLFLVAISLWLTFCTSLNNIECFSSGVSLAVCNKLKLKVCVGFIQEVSNFLMCEFLPITSNIILTEFLLKLVFQKVSL